MSFPNFFRSQGEIDDDGHNAGQEAAGNEKNDLIRLINDISSIIRGEDDPWVKGLVNGRNNMPKEKVVEDRHESSSPEPATKDREYDYGDDYDDDDGYDDDDDDDDEDGEDYDEGKEDEEEDEEDEEDDNDYYADEWNLETVRKMNSPGWQPYPDECEWYRDQNGQIVRYFSRRNFTHTTIFAFTTWELEEEFLERMGNPLAEYDEEYYSDADDEEE